MEELQLSIESQKAQKNISKTNPEIKINNVVDISKRKSSGPIKFVSTAASKGNISNFKSMHTTAKKQILEEEIEKQLSKVKLKENKSDEDTAQKSILKKNNLQANKDKNVQANKVQLNDKRISNDLTAEDTETSGYKSNSSRNNESSETESDYGYATIKQSTTLKRVELSLQSNLSSGSGVLPEECWVTVKIKSVNDENVEYEDSDVLSKDSDTILSKSLYDYHCYLNSIGFMTNFVDNFMVKLGPAIGLTSEAINNALTQGASIYCDNTKGGIKFGLEIIPAIIAAWPNAANPWIIRKRKMITNPRTNQTYLWPTKTMINSTINLGCLLLPIGLRYKRGINPYQKFQWKIVFPAAECYLKSCLAHSHIRIYLFTLALQKTFMEIESSKIGIDSSHIKNHLFWYCENNYARFPEDRLGETLRIFLRNFYNHFKRGTFPNYFIETCNDFESIPMPVLRKLQYRLRDILEAPVMHSLCAIQKLKYNSKEFYPRLNVNRLYQILTCKNPLRLLNPDIPTYIKPNITSESDDEDNHANVWHKAKVHDPGYQWKKRKRKAQERRLALNSAKKNKKTLNIANTLESNYNVSIIYFITVLFI